MDWEYFRFYSLVSPGFRKDSDDGTVELIIKVSNPQIVYLQSVFKNWKEKT